MNKIFFSVGMVALIALTSCEKCATCSCTNNLTYDFSDSISSETQTQIKDAYSTAFNEDYPTETAEICEKRKEFDSATDSYEKQSTTYEENNTSGGYGWTIEGSYTCQCIED